MDKAQRMLYTLSKGNYNNGFENSFLIMPADTNIAMIKIAPLHNSNHIQMLPNNDLYVGMSSDHTKWRQRSQFLITNCTISYCSTFQISGLRQFLGRYSSLHCQQRHPLLQNRLKQPAHFGTAKKIKTSTGSGMNQESER
jgi:hypothetical protein